MCSAIDLELEGGKDNSALNIPMDRIETVSLSDGESLTINLKTGEDGEAHHAVISVSLALDNKSEGYKTYGPDGISAKADLIRDEVNKIVGSHTIEEMRESQADVQDEILARLRRMFDSDFIVSVAFPTYTYE